MCKRAGVSSSTPSICAQIVDRQTDLEHRDGLKLCLAILMIDLANAHTQTTMDACGLRTRLETLAEGIELPEATDGQWEAIAVHLAQVAPNLENLQINEQPVVTKYDQHAYQIARIAHLEASVGLAVSAMSDSHYGLDLDGGRLASHLTDEQRNAVLSSVQSKLSIIVGGPGTGKTSIIVELLRVVYELGLQPERMVLAAPTGKAAYRMGESVSNALQRHQDPSQRALQERLSAPMTLHLSLIHI